MEKTEILRTVAALSCLILIAGCSAQVNIVDGSHPSRGFSFRKIVRIDNGTERSIETNDHVVFHEGEIAHFPSGTVVKLHEKNGGEVNAELRDENGKLVLWMKENGKFRKGEAKDDAWLKQFLGALKLDDRQPKESVQSALTSSPFNEPSFRKALDGINMSSDRAEALKNCCRERDLTAEQQIAIINAAYDKLTMTSEKRDVLLDFIRDQKRSPGVRKAIIARLDSIDFESDREAIQKSLLETE